MDRQFLWIVENFTEGPQLLATQILMLTWSVADLVLIVALLKIAGLARARAGGPPIRFRYAILALTAFLTPGLALCRTSMQIFAVESAITIPQYLILIVSLVLERRTLLAMVEERVRQAARLTGS